jgi:AcrR family transcriptional regulator
MPEQTGLRDRKKLQTRRVISEAAIALFMARGFDNVSVTDIAQSADVSRQTVFNYFRTKEDLVLHRFSDHVDEPARVVRERPAGTDTTTALRNWFVASLAEHHPTTGLCDDPAFLAFQRMVLATPSLRIRLLDQQSASEEALAAALADTLGTGPDDPAPRLAASQIVAVHQTLVLENVRWLAAGGSLADRHDAAIKAAEIAFDLLDHGLGGLGG